MAMLDDRSFLVTHIRNSFITSDDTGMCELILENDDVAGGAAQEHERHLSYSSDRRPTSWPYPNTRDAEHAKVVCSLASMDSDTELAHSCDIVPDMDFGGHRRRSDTAQRLDKLKREKHKQSQIKHVQWKLAKNTGMNSTEVFEKKSVNRTGPKELTSALSLQLKSFEATPSNAFIDYAKFDGRASGGMPTKKIDIYLTMATANERSFPMTVTTLCTAKVQNLIGLICWQYTTERREPALSENIDCYSLYMVEDDGEVDMDFPPLENREPIAKFGFSKLALVQRAVAATVSQKPSYAVTVNVPGQGAIKVLFDNDAVLFKELLDKVLAQRNPPPRPGFIYRLEKQSSPGVTIDLDLPLSAVNAVEFSLVRENSVREGVDDADATAELPDSPTIDQSLSSHHYQSYIVNMMHKLRSNTEVRIGISEEKIEIYPTGMNTKFLPGSFTKQKAVLYNMDEVASCVLREEKSSGRAVFRVVHRNQSESKHRDFECDIRTAKEIVSKVSKILELRLSSIQNNYTEERVKKASRRHTFHI